MFSKGDNNYHTFRGICGILFFIIIIVTCRVSCLFLFIFVKYPVGQKCVSFFYPIPAETFSGLYSNNKFY